VDASFRLMTYDGTTQRDCDATVPTQNVPMDRICHLQSRPALQLPPIHSKDGHHSQPRQCGDQLLALACILSLVQYERPSEGCTMPDNLVAHHWRGRPPTCTHLHIQVRSIPAENGERAGAGVRVCMSPHAQHACRWWQRYSLCMLTRVRAAGRRGIWDLRVYSQQKVLING